jgi:four helix bundle protein
MQDEQPGITSYRQLIVWQKSMDLVVRVYGYTQQFPAEEKFGLISQMRRAAVSIPSNIAEGRGRNTRKDFIQFLHVALGSLAELETQLDVACRVLYLKEVDYNAAMALASEIKRMLYKMLSSLKAIRSKL